MSANAGQFRPGQSGNPGGRPKGLGRYVRELIGEDGRRVADFMLGVLEDAGEPLKRRMQAASWLADRGFGRATSPLGGDEERPVRIVVESIARRPEHRQDG